MKKYIFLPVVIFFSIFPLYTSAYAYTESDAREIESKHDEIEEQIHKELTKIFNIKVSEYKKMDIIELALLTKRDPYLFNLLEISIDLCNKKCIGSPIVYYSPEKTYILAMIDNGKRVLLEFTKINNSYWKVVSEKIK